MGRMALPLVFRNHGVRCLGFNSRIRSMVPKLPSGKKNPIDMLNDLLRSAVFDGSQYMLPNSLGTIIRCCDRLACILSLTFHCNRLVSDLTELSPIVLLVWFSFVDFFCMQHSWKVSLYFSPNQRADNFISEMSHALSHSLISDMLFSGQSKNCIIHFYRNILLHDLEFYCWPL